MTLSHGMTFLTDQLGGLVGDSVSNLGFPEPDVFWQFWTTLNLSSFNQCTWTFWKIWNFCCIQMLVILIIQELQGAKFGQI